MGTKTEQIIEQTDQYGARNYNLYQLFSQKEKAFG